MAGFHSAARGFSTIELLVTIGIVAILAATALPSFYSTIGSVRVNGLATALYRDLKVAQAEAIRRGRPIGIYAKGAVPDWANGWYVAENSGSTSLVDREAPDASYLITASTSGGTPPSPTAVTSVVFKQMGIVSGAGTAITFQACQRSSRASARQQIAVQASGSVVSSALANGPTSATGC